MIILDVNKCKWGSWTYYSAEKESWTGRWQSPSGSLLGNNTSNVVSWCESASSLCVCRGSGGSHWPRYGMSNTALFAAGLPVCLQFARPALDFVLSEPSLFFLHFTHFCIIYFFLPFLVAGHLLLCCLAVTFVGFFNTCLFSMCISLSQSCCF